MKQALPDRIHVLFTADEHYAVHIPTVIKSIQVNHPRHCFHVHMICANLSERLATQLKNYCEKIDFPFSLYYVPDTLFSDAPVNKHYSKAMYYRMLAAEILPESIERVLYLDPDLLVINSLEPLWELAGKDWLFAAASHGEEDGLVDNLNRLRLDTSSPYFNTGVLLIQLDRCRKQLHSADIFRFIEKNDHRLLLPDQDVFNALYGTYTRLIPDEIWNYDARKYSQYLLRSGGKIDDNWVIRNTSILHYCGKDKPWDINYRCHYGILYRHYEQLCMQDGWLI